MKQIALWSGAAAVAMSAAVGGSLLTPSDEPTALDELLFAPVALARALCGADEQTPFGSRRAYFLAAATAYAQARSEVDPDAPPPIVVGLAQERVPVTTDNAAAQTYFEQGVALSFGFNHGDAIRAFQQAQVLDPSCAMCFWGEAFAWGPNINAPRDPNVEAQALAAAQRAAELAEGVSDEEKALIDAIQVRYSADEEADFAALDTAFADAMIAAAEAHPDSDAILAIAAEAIMDESPWNYWEEDGVTPRGRTALAVEFIETILARTPNHAPAIHLYIHLTEATPDPWRAEAGADRLLSLAPASGHLVHMPSHVYYRVGRFKDSIAANIDAVAADEAFFAEAGEDSLLYRYGYYPHNIHFVMTSAQMSGDAATALDMVGKLDASIPMEMTAVANLVQPVKAAPLFALAQFGDAAQVVATPEPDGAPPYITAMWRYARGEAYARLGDIEAARGEARAIARIARDTDFTSMVEELIPVPAILSVAEQVVLGRAALYAGESASAVDHFAAAVESQAEISYMEPPYWYYPVRQSLAAALLMDGQAARAEYEFQRTLVESPDNAWAFWGLMQARQAQGDRVGARSARNLWRDRWAGGRRSEPELARL